MSVITVPASIFAKRSASAPLPAVEHSTAWLNSEPLTAADLRGKVILVDFWTYTCINWRRTLPWLRAWDQKYRSAGLVVLGVHTPEFSFEKDIDNVRTVSGEQRVDYPIAIDSDRIIWNAFQNQYWPALYLVDAQGRIRHEQFGEGDYDRLEALIQQLLAEAGHPTQQTDNAPIKGAGAEAPADWKSLRSPETYVGHARAESFASPGGALLDRAQVYASPSSLRLNTWALTGYWTVKSEFAVSHKTNGRIAYRFHARDVHVVLGPGARGKPIRFRVTIDGQLPGASHGLDVDADGAGTIVEPRMYQLIRQQQPIADRLVEIEFLDPGAQVCDFTFG
jgi:thiol-disulfide isomerase/thioredoxin